MNASLGISRLFGGLSGMLYMKLMAVPQNNSKVHLNFQVLLPGSSHQFPKIMQSLPLILSTQNPFSLLNSLYLEF